MSAQTISIINNATVKKEKYDILTFDTHERYQTQLCKTGHNFYSFRYQDCKKWDTDYAPTPKNYYTLPENTLMRGIDFDFILSQSKFGQLQAVEQINKHLTLPVISLEHTLPLQHWPPQQLETFQKMTGDINVFISDFSVKMWGISPSTVIHHSVDTNLFRPDLSHTILNLDYHYENVKKENVVLSVVNNFKERDYCCNYSGWERITSGLPVKLVGKNPDLSEPASSVEDLVNQYNTSAVFLNTSTVSPIPTSLLEAMSCGCAVVSTATCMIPEIIENGTNGFMSNDETELKAYIQMLLEEPELAKMMGDFARRTVLSNFSEDKFIKSWNQVFDSAYRMKK